MLLPDNDIQFNIIQLNIISAFMKHATFSHLLNVKLILSDLQTKKFQPLETILTIIYGTYKRH